MNSQTTGEECRNYAAGSSTAREIGGHRSMGLHPMALLYNVGGEKTWLLSVRFQILTTLTVTIAAFWDVTPCIIVNRQTAF